MLYVYCMHGRNSYEIMDTDDGKREVVDADNLYHLCVKLGIHIEGVVLDRTAAYGEFVKNVYVVQLEKDASPRKAKLLVMYGIDMKTSGSEITSISAPNGILGKTCEIRLSDYGTSCSPNILQRVCLDLGCKLILKLDDKIAIKSRTFNQMWSFVYIDLTEVTKLDTVERVYSCLPSISKIKSHIIDIPERLDYFTAVKLLEGRSVELDDLKDFVVSVPETQKLIEHTYKSMFASLASHAIKIDDTATAAYEASMLINRNHSWEKIRANTPLNKKDLSLLFRRTEKFTRKFTDFKTTDLVMFYNYFRYFTPSEEMFGLARQFLSNLIVAMDAAIKRWY